MNVKFLTGLGVVAITFASGVISPVQAQISAAETSQYYRAVFGETPFPEHDGKRTFEREGFEFPRILRDVDPVELYGRPLTRVEAMEWNRNAELRNQISGASSPASTAFVRAVVPPEQPPEQTPEQPPEQTPEQPPEQTPEQPPEQTPEQPPEQPTTPVSSNASDLLVYAPETQRLPLPKTGGSVVAINGGVGNGTSGFGEAAAVTAAFPAGQNAIITLGGDINPSNSTVSLAADYFFSGNTEESFGVAMTGVLGETSGIWPSVVYANAGDITQREMYYRLSARLGYADDGTDGEPGGLNTGINVQYIQPFARNLAATASIDQQFFGDWSNTSTVGILAFFGGAPEGNPDPDTQPDPDPDPDLEPDSCSPDAIKIIFDAYAGFRVSAERWMIIRNWVCYSSFSDVEAGILKYGDGVANSSVIADTVRREAVEHLLRLYGRQELYEQYLALPVEVQTLYMDHMRTLRLDAGERLTYVID